MVTFHLNSGHSTLFSAVTSHIKIRSDFDGEEGDDDEDDKHHKSLTDDGDDEKDDENLTFPMLSVWRRRASASPACSEKILFVANPFLGKKYFQYFSGIVPPFLAEKHLKNISDKM